MSTVKFTFTVDLELLRRAELVAAQSGTSVDALFNAELLSLVETFERAEAAGNANHASLLAFSLGKLGHQATMDRLGIDSEEELFLLMAQAHLPMPRLRDAETGRMVRLLHTETERLAP